VGRQGGRAAGGTIHHVSSGGSVRLAPVHPGPSLRRGDCAHRRAAMQGDANPMPLMVKGASSGGNIRRLSRHGARSERLRDAIS